MSVPGTYDRTLFYLTLLFTALGVVAVANVSAPQALEVFGDSYHFVKQQLFWGTLGLVALFITSRIPYMFWKKVSPVLFLVSLALLVAVLLPGFGARVLGARRWLKLGPITFQPSEFVKLSLAIYFASLVERERNLVNYLLILGLVAGLVMLQPDLGTTIVIVGIGMAELFVAGVSLITMFGMMAAGSVVGGAAVLLSSYRRERLLTFLQGTRDPLGASYHIRQILIAVGSGGFFGTGLGQSRQKFLFLPEVATDSVFAVLAEEIGFVGSSVLVLAFAFFLMRAIRVAMNAPDRFSSVLAAGIATWIGGQMFLNIGSMVALVPLTGIPLPFFSYGGSSLLMILTGMGILLNISRYAKVKKKIRRVKK